MEIAHEATTRFIPSLGKFSTSRYLEGIDLSHPVVEGYVVIATSLQDQ